MLSSAGRASPLQGECRRFDPYSTHHIGVVVQLVRIPACHAGGRGFESRPLRQPKAHPIDALFFYHIRCNTQFCKPINQKGEFMLQSFRKYTQGWVATMMGIILSFAFILWGIENYLSGHSKKDIAAKVNGKEITIAEVNADFQRMIMRLKDQMGTSFSLTPLMQQELKIQALNNLVMQNVLLQAAINAGFRVTSQATSAMIKQMPAFQEEGNFSKERFHQIISKLGYSQQEFFSDVSASLLLNQVASGVIGSEFVLPNELNQAVALLEQKRDIEYAIIPVAQFKKNIHITEEQIKDYYLIHRDAFKVPAKVQLEYVQLSIDDLKKTVKITDQDLNDYFEANSDLDRKNPKVMIKAKEAIQQQQLEKAFLAASDKLTDLTYTNPKSLVEAAKILGLQIKTSEFFTQAGGDTPITKNPKIITSAFSADSIKDHTNSNLIEISPGNVVVLRAKNYQMETIAPIDQAKDKIRDVLTEKEAQVQAQQKGEKILEVIQDKNDFKKIALSAHLSPIIKKNISRHGKNVDREVLQIAFSIPPSARKPAYGTPLSNGDYVIVVVKNSVNLPASQITQEQRLTMEKLYSHTYGKLDYHLYSENQIERSKIKNLMKE